MWHALCKCLFTLGKQVSKLSICCEKEEDHDLSEV